MIVLPVLLPQVDPVSDKIKVDEVDMLRPW
jgi:hypothetical protein